MHHSEGLAACIGIATEGVCPQTSVLRWRDRVEVLSWTTWG